MAVNLLTITKEANDYFTFVLNGDTVNAIKNTRNDLTTVGDRCDFKSSNGANLIKQQNITYGNVTIIDGATTLVPVSVDDLFAKLISVNYFDWITGAGGGGGVNRFDELLDTFSYFGKDGQVLRVNESELKLETFILNNATKSTDLTDMPAFLIANKMVITNPTATGYIFIDKPAGSSGYTQPFVYASPDPQTFTLASSAGVSAVFINGGFVDPVDYTVSANLLTILGTYTLVTGDKIVVTGVI
jgi:hypothetical protein